MQLLKDLASLAQDGAADQIRPVVADDRARLAAPGDGGVQFARDTLAGYPPTPLPVHVLYSPSRQLSPRVRVVIEWMAEQFSIREA